MDLDRVRNTLGHAEFNVVPEEDVPVEVRNVVLKDIQRWVSILASFGGVLPFNPSSEFEVGYIDLREDTSNPDVVDSNVQIVFQGQRTTQIFDMLPPPGWPQSHYATASILISMYKKEQE